MKTIVLIRHAKSSWEHHWLADLDRPLNERGEKDAPRMASLLAEHIEKPDLLICSPAKRTLATAEAFAKVFDMEEEITIEEKLYEAHASEILELIQNLNEEIKTVVLIGHNPSMTNLSNRFEGPFFDNLPTCGIICFETKADTWNKLDDHNTHVTHFYFPKIHLK